MKSGVSPEDLETIKTAEKKFNEGDYGGAAVLFALVDVALDFAVIDGQGVVLGKLASKAAMIPFQTLIPTWKAK